MVALDYEGLEGLKMLTNGHVADYGSNNNNGSESGSWLERLSEGWIELTGRPLVDRSVRPTEDDIRAAHAAVITAALSPDDGDAAAVAIRRLEAIGLRLDRVGGLWRSAMYLLDIIVDAIDLDIRDEADRNTEG